MELNASNRRILRFPGKLLLKITIYSGFSQFSHEKWWFSIVFCMFTRGYPQSSAQPSPRAVNPAMPTFTALPSWAGRWSTCRCAGTDVVWKIDGTSVAFPDMICRYLQFWWLIFIRFHDSVSLLEAISSPRVILALKMSRLNWWESFVSCGKPNDNPFHLLTIWGPFYIIYHHLK